MSAEYAISQRQGYLRIDVYPSITFAGMLQAYREVGAMDRERPQPRLWRFPDELPPRLLAEFSFERIQQLIPAGMQEGVEGKAAFVCEDDVLFGKTRQTVGMRPDENERFQVFRSEAEALQWLDVEGG